MLRMPYRAPKAGALPGCATPRHEVRIHYKALPSSSLSKTGQFGLELCQNCARIPSCARVPSLNHTSAFALLW
jgi:hypothetical protein